MDVFKQSNQSGDFIGLTENESIKLRKRDFFENNKNNIFCIFFENKGRYPVTYTAQLSIDDVVNNIELWQIPVLITKLADHLYAMGKEAADAARIAPGKEE